ncbi:MAG: hypothetical protein ACREP9_02070, partial [Candidatus Dormibacteraceae bacterium]
ALQLNKVINTMERMARSGFSVGRYSEYFSTRYRKEVRYRSIPPLGVVYRIVGRELRILRVVDQRRMRVLP